MGAMGGRPGQALFFVGLQNEELIFLDPHLVQEAANLEEEWIDCNDDDLIEEAKRMKETVKIEQQKKKKDPRYFFKRAPKK